MAADSPNGDPSGEGQVPPIAAVRGYVRAVVAEVTGVPVEELAAPDALRELGLSSLARMNITVRFDQDLGDVEPTLTFEYPTVAELADHLLATRPAELARLIPVSGAATAPPQARPDLSFRPDRTEQAERSAGAPSADIAVIAVTGRYPGAPDVEALWRNLRDGVRSTGEVPADRWDWRAHFDPHRGRPGRTHGRWGGFLDGVAEFDAELFHVLPLDAAHLDPQERLFLQTCWHLLEQAGMLGPTTHEPETGVFVGSMNHTYGKIGATRWPLGELTGPNSAPWSIANRVSYFFDLHGPSFAVDSACSSSLTAVHLACESLRRGECRTAIAGGVNLILHPAHLVGLSASSMLSSDEACKVFDAAADGFVPGEGVGAVLLKQLAAAVADGDHVWGVIKGSALNTAGRTSGYTVPNPARQSDLVTAAAERAGVDPATLSYVEAHGTGTALGDPLEIAGLARALAPGRPADRPCPVGSLKANIGHLEGAAGVAGLTKVLLQLKYGQLAPCVGLEELNPKIDTSVVRFPRETEAWVAAPGVPRRAGVSAFGAGGANAHLILEEYRPAVTGPEDAPVAEEEQLVLLSARTGERLRVLAGALARALSEEPGGPVGLAGLAYGSQVGRRELAERLAVTARDRAGLRTALEAFVAGRSAPGLRTGAVRTDAGPAGLLDDEDGRAYLDALVDKRRLDRLAALWVDGVPVDWARLWPAPTPRRAALPPYPFEPRRFWVDPAAPFGATGRAGDAGDAAAPVGGTAADGPATAVEEVLRQAAAGFLLIDPAEVDVEADLMELGFDSIALVLLTAQVGEAFGIELDPLQVLDHPTLAALRTLLMTEHPDAVAARHGGTGLPGAAG
ncbi:beta-ketoacyl synthase N-terminal-like domain-containing protein [Kitasatospora sp. CM 4170]|uniref:Beta-ketoacyl synthase N-terminal-like domain-containing protein n=1 Tax=Kitasatospora aburaviensis TaxID=67265 RepID=A0ABW1ERY2_9ACTN|nr:beta-ketoacyl synthase N-terminal-like domain-containing protein [Kitasatospora sp. CM 4170]WNM44681.1 beta-ketoacyl synthase N-terminal-like domain-containing protein [Kitasatospora sp. CM 4170]